MVMFEDPTAIEALALTEFQGVLCKLDTTGDTKVVWDRRNADEVANAKRTFDDLKTKGYMAYTVKKNGEQGEVINEFDPNAEMMIMSAPIVGG